MSNRVIQLRSSWAGGVALLGVGAAAASACGGADTGDLFNTGATASAGVGGNSATASSTSSQGDTTASTGPTGPTGAGQGGASQSSGGASADCDNGTKDPGEECDGAKLGDSDCTDFGFSNPAGLACSTDCKLTQAGCKATCGDGKIEPGEACDDSNVASGDGCSSACSVETVECAGAIPVMLAPGTIKLTGSTVGGGDHQPKGCNGAAGPDRIYAVKPTSNGFLTASLTRAATSFDSVLYVSQTCAKGGEKNELLCADSVGDQNGAPLEGGEVVSIRIKPNTVYYVFVDGSTAGVGGDFELVLDLSSGTDCNDPIPIPLEAGSPMTFLGSTNETGASSAAGTCGGSMIPDVVYEITRVEAGPIDVLTDPALTDYNSVLYTRFACNLLGTQLDCSDAPGTGGDTLSLPDVNPSVPIFVWVDGSSQGAGNGVGSYGLVVTP